MAVKTTKQTGQVFTPNYLVSNVLDLCGYQENADIVNKHVIDNSCGNGAFLTEIVRRFIGAYRKASYTESEIIQALETYVHGIELDSEEVGNCKTNLTDLASSLGIKGITWDIDCSDALSHTRHLGKMDYVLGNPPYVRVHNMGVAAEFLKTNYSFTRGGMGDLYIAFYELGLYMLNETGVLGYVTPSSFFASKAGGIMREYITQSRSIKTIVDLGHFQPFNAATYVTIVVLTKQENKSIEYYNYDEQAKQPYEGRTLEYGDFSTEYGTFLFDKNELVYKVLASDGTQKLCSVKNGFTTLLDEFFIADKFPFDDYIIPVLKASTGVLEACLYPYDEKGKLIPYKVMIANPEIAERYAAYRAKLLARDLASNSSWHTFGRYQGIRDVYTNKYAINNLIRDEKDIKFNVCPPGTGVYSGLYIVTEVPEERIREILITKEFAQFVKALGKYKSGGYYTYTSKEVQLYLNYFLTEDKSIA